MKKKLWLSSGLLSTLGIVALPIASVVSCGSSTAATNYTKVQNQAAVDAAVAALGKIDTSSKAAGKPADWPAVSTETEITADQVGLLDNNDSSVTAKWFLSKLTPATGDEAVTEVEITVNLSAGADTTAATGTATITLKTFGTADTDQTKATAAANAYPYLNTTSDATKTTADVTVTETTPDKSATELFYTTVSPTQGATITKIDNIQKDDATGVITADVNFTVNAAAAKKTIIIAGYKIATT